MTFSLLVRDPETGQLGGAAATGSLCVGGWVLRGDVRRGLSASQGTAPSTLWGEDVLCLMADGISAPDAVAQIVAADPGRAHRQLAALDPSGRSAAFTGAETIPKAGALQTDDAVAAGNMLASDRVLSDLLEGYSTAAGPLPDRLFAALRAAAQDGGDWRGLRSAALLVLGPTHPPLTLRIDRDDRPLDALAALLAEATTGSYARWSERLPTRAAPHRAGPFDPT